MAVTGADAASLIAEIRHRRFITDEIELAFANEIKIAYRGNHWSVLNCAAYYGNVSILRILLKNEKLIKQIDLDTSLHIAAEKDHSTVVELLLKHKANIEYENNDEETALLIAVRYGNEGTVNILIKEKANVDARNQNGKTSLHVACEEGFLGIVKLLLHAGAVINLPRQTNGMGQIVSPMLHICFERRNKVLAELLLKNGADLNIKNGNGYDILDLAFLDFTDFSKFLIRFILYLNINTPIPERHNSGEFSKFWDTCKSELELMETCQIADTNISYGQLLLESDKSKLAAYLSNADVVSELDALVYKEKFPIYKQYFTEKIMKGKSRLRLHYKADEVMNHVTPFLPIVVPRKRDKIMTVTGAEAESLVSEIINRTFITDEIESAFANNIKIEYHGNYWSVLNCAACYGNVSILHILLKNEKLIKQKDLDTSLHIAVEEYHSTVVELLLKHKANIEYENNDGETPLLTALKCENEDIVDILIEEGANVNARDNFDNTSLHVACEKGFLSIVKLLLDAGAAINLQNVTGWTPLFCAADSDRVDVVKLLLHRGADVEIPDNSGNTVLHICVQRLNRVLTKLLLQNGADVTSENDDGKDVLQLSLFDIGRGGSYDNFVRLILYSNINSNKPSRPNNPRFSKFWDECKSELELMETCKIGETNISYGQLLLERNKNKLAAYFTNANIVSELDTLVYKKQFPIYKQYFSEKILKGKSRLRLHYKADEVMNQIRPFLPIVVRRNIYNYLCYDDFKNLINAY